MDKEKFLDFVKFAIEKESLSYNFYMRASDASRFKRTKIFFKKLAEEEKEQKKVLKNLIEKERHVLENIKSIYMNINGYFKNEEFKLGITFNETRQIAIRIEDYSIQLYRDLCNAVQNYDFKNVFSKILEEESEHKHRIEEDSFGK